MAFTLIQGHCTVQPWPSMLTAQYLMHKNEQVSNVIPWHCPQYKKLCFSCAIRKELDQWILQSWNVILLHPLISNFIFEKHHVLQIKEETANIWEYKEVKTPLLPILGACKKPENFLIISVGHYGAGCKFSTSTLSLWLFGWGKEHLVGFKACHDKILSFICTTVIQKII